MANPSTELIGTYIILGGCRTQVSACGHDIGNTVDSIASLCAVAELGLMFLFVEGRLITSRVMT